MSWPTSENSYSKYCIAKAAYRYLREYLTEQVQKRLANFESNIYVNQVMLSDLA